MASAPQLQQLARTPEAFCLKKKGQSHQFKPRDCEMGESQGRQELHLSGKEENQIENEECKEFAPH